MSPKRQRLWFIVFALGMLGCATAFILTSFKDSLVFFYSPSELAAKPPANGQYIRVGGLVEAGSIQKSGDSIAFIITDTKDTLTVDYTGALPALFREGQGVVAEGKMGTDGHFAATRILAKHDENYMPPEVADALKKQGYWKGKKQ